MMMMVCCYSDEPKSTTSNHKARTTVCRSRLPYKLCGSLSLVSIRHCNTVVVAIVFVLLLLLLLLLLCCYCCCKRWKLNATRAQGPSTTKKAYAFSFTPKLTVLLRITLHNTARCVTPQCSALHHFALFIASQ